MYEANVNIAPIASTLWVPNDSFYSLNVREKPNCTIFINSKYCYFFNYDFGT